MKVALVVFPGSNCDRDLAVAFRQAGATVEPLWHKEASLPQGTDLVALPGGFSWGDYLRCGAMAARAPVMAAVAEHVKRGGATLGICNGFQVLLEAGLLPGALMRNAGLKFICRTVPLEVSTADSAFTATYRRGEVLQIPIAHHDGNYVADTGTLARLEDEDRIAFRYGHDENGSAGRIAGILSENRRTLGMMPHPERAADPRLGAADGARLFSGTLGALLEAA